MTVIEEQVQYETIRYLNASLHPQSSFDVFKQNLAAYINELINYDFEKLIHLLYRIDVSEQKLKSFLANQQANAGNIIAALIIERQLQKIKTREQFKHQDNSFDEEEHW